MKEYLKELIRRNGFEKALKICHARMQGSDPHDWQYLPKGIVFYEKDKRSSNTNLNEKHLRKLHNFWTDAYGKMKKMEKNR